MARGSGFLEACVWGLNFALGEQSSVSASWLSCPEMLLSAIHSQPDVLPYLEPKAME